MVLHQRVALGKRNHQDGCLEPGYPWKACHLGALCQCGRYVPTREVLYANLHCAKADGHEKILSLNLLKLWLEKALVYH